MAFDFIDMIVDTGEEYLTGAFYKRRPVSSDDGGVSFMYRQLDPNAKVFDKILGEVRKDRATYALKTNDNCGFNIGGYIQTQNGLFWEITEVITSEEVKGSNEVLRWFKTAKNSEINVRMIQVDDLYNIENAYATECKIRIESEKKMQSVNVEVWTLDGKYNVSETVNATIFNYTVTKGERVDLQINFEDGTTKKITISKDKTVVNNLNYSI